MLSLGPLTPKVGVAEPVFPTGKRKLSEGRLHWSRVPQRPPAAHLALQPRSAHLRPALLPACPCHSKAAPWAHSTGITPEFIRNADSRPSPGTLTWINRPQGTPAGPSGAALCHSCLPDNLQSPDGPSTLRFRPLSWLSSPCPLGPLRPPCSVSSLSSHPRVLVSAPLLSHSTLSFLTISFHFMVFSPLMTGTHVHRPINISPRHLTPEPHEVQNRTGIVREVKLLTAALLRASSGLPRCSLMGRSSQTHAVGTMLTI